MSSTQSIDSLVEDAPQAEVNSSRFADPTALGFAAVGLPFGVVCLNLTESVSPDIAIVMLPLVLAYGAIGLYVAGSTASKLGDVFGAFAFSSFAAFFLSFGLIQVLLAAKVTVVQAAGQGSAFAVFTGAWSLIVAYLAVLSFRYPPVFRIVFVSVWVTLILLTIGFAGLHGVLITGAWIGLATAVLCLYVSAAVLINAVVGRPILPLYLRSA